MLLLAIKRNRNDDSEWRQEYWHEIRIAMKSLAT